MGPHTPLTPAPFLAELQAMQSPMHEESQQTPSTQEPLRHWPLFAQGLPC